jgi:hypothetical protein
VRRLVVFGVLLLVACGGSSPPPPDAGLDAGADAGPGPDAEVDAGPGEVTLTVTVTGDGPGRVVSTPVGIDCNEACTATFAPGAVVTLAVTPGAGAVLGAWGGAGSACSGATCTLTLSADAQVSVALWRHYTLTVEATGDGLGVVTVGEARCQGRCEVEVLSNTQLNLQALPGAGSDFGGWSGACSGPDPLCRVGVTGDLFVRPLFTARTPQLSGGEAHFCALLRPDSVRCWGRGSRGRLGRQSDEDLGDDEAVAAQGDLPLGFDVAQVSAGGAHTCVLSTAGKVRCWGANGDGQLGQGNTVDVGQAGGAAPADLPDVDLGPEAAVQVSAGGAHTCALMASGKLRCWGRGAEGQLGYGDTLGVGDGVGLDVSAAGEVDAGGEVRFVSAGGQHTCAVYAGGDVRCWGANDLGQAGYAAGSSSPAGLEPLPLGAPALQVHAGARHTCVRFEDGRVKCFGDNRRGQLGDGTTDQVGGPGGLPVETAITVGLDPDRAVEVAVGGAHGCATLTNGNVRCWGAGTSGATGYEATDDALAPLGPVALPTGGRHPVALAALDATTCLIQRFGAGVSDYALLCWGDGAHGTRASGDTAAAGDRPGTMPPAASSLY